MVLDETGFLRKGKKSAGVARQYSGTAGKIENCQIGVFLSYASRRGTCVWVVADEAYGRNRRVRVWLEAREQPFVLAVPSNEKLWQPGFRHVAASVITAGLEDGAWKHLSAGQGEKGPRLYDWACIPLSRLADPEWEYWLLVRRSVDMPEEVLYHVAFQPAGTMLNDLVQVAGMRWMIDRDFEGAKQEAGLEEYEVRNWTGWNRKVTLSLLAHEFLAGNRALAGDEKGVRFLPCAANRARGAPSPLRVGLE